MNTPKVKFAYKPNPREFPYVVEMLTAFVEAYNNYQPGYRLINLETGSVSYSAKKPEPKEKVEVEIVPLREMYEVLTGTGANPD